jgi:hypothetical protein
LFSFDVMQYLAGVCKEEEIAVCLSAPVCGFILKEMNL